MPLFGQVWLWSLLAFLLGALLCWLLVAFPARRRVGELQARLAAAGRLADAHRGAEADRKRREARATPKPTDEDFPAPALVPGFGDDYPHPGGATTDAGSLTRAYAMPGVVPPPGRTEEVEAAERGMLRLSAEAAGATAPHPSSVGGALDVGSPGPYAPPEPPQIDAAETELADAGQSGQSEATRYLSSVSGPLPTAPPVGSHPPVEAPPELDSNRDWFAAEELEDEPARQDEHLVDDEEPDGDTGGTIFTERTTPIPVDLIRRLDEQAEAEQEEVHRPQDSLVDDLSDEEDEENVEESEVGADAAASPAMASVDARTEVVAPVGAPQETGAHAKPERAEVRPADAGERTEVHARAQPAPAAPARPERTRRVSVEAKLAPGMTVVPEHTQSALPKRVPSKPVHRHPFGVKTTSPAHATTTTMDGDDRVRSLFEPIVPAEDDGEPAPPPPNRVHTGHRSSGSPGPFGPGSAMPLPGGAAPSPDFTIKASVTALRYCTPESPQFGRTVAEVWFRSAADAERVGFRPVG